MSTLPNFRQVFAPDEAGSRVVALQSGPLVHIPRLLPSVDAGSPLGAQLDSVLERMRSIVGEAGGGLDDIARVTLFMREVKDRRTLNDVWSRWFPDPERRPPHKYIPADVPGGYAVMLDALAVLDRERKTLKIAGVEHRDPMAMGSRTGRLVCSSRLFAAEPNPDKQFSVLLEQARVLMAEAGGDLADLTQVTVFAPTPEAAAAMEQLCRAYWADAQSPPDLHVLVMDLGGTPTCRIEVMGVLSDAAPSPAGG
jgi:enamine deaminase RidA (YjgF/YER057c/UK114 family)